MSGLGLNKELKYYKIYKDIKEKIISYKLLSGTQILGVRELMEYYSASYATVSEALKKLEGENLITRVQGKGIFVQKSNFWDKSPDSSNTIGLIVTDMSIPFFGRLIEVLEKELSLINYDVLIRNSDFSSSLEKGIIETFMKKGVKGTIIVPTFDEADSEFLKEVDGKDISIVYIIRSKSSYNCSYVVPDDYMGAFEAVDHIIKKGHKKIGYISGKKIKGRDLKFEAFKDCIRSRGLVFNPDWAVEGEFFEVDSGYWCMNKLLELPELPTAVFCYTDSMAVGAMKACKERGISIPEDMSFVGYNNDEISLLVEPQVTTVNNSIDTICKLAVKTIVDLINNPVSEPVQIKIPVKLIERQSVKEYNK